MTSSLRCRSAMKQVIGEGGSSLSAGQKQLISFARALLADPQILIMDEATSSVDTLTEARIEQGLRAYSRTELASSLPTDYRPFAMPIKLWSSMTAASSSKAIMMNLLRDEADIITSFNNKV